MNPASPSPLTLRLMACVESFSHDEDGAVGHDDWPELARILDRELDLLGRIAQEEPSTDPALSARAGALSRRYATLSERIAAARARAEAELATIGETTRHIRNVRRAYSKD